MTSILILRVYPYSPQGGNYDIWWDVNPKGCGDPGPMPMVVSSSSWGYPRYHPSFWLGSSPINQPFWGYPYLRKAPYHTISIIHLQVTIEFRYTIHLLFIYSSSAVHLLFIYYACTICCYLRTTHQWIGSRGILQETKDFPMKIMGFSCNFSPS